MHKLSRRLLLAAILFSVANKSVAGAKDSSGIRTYRTFFSIAVSGTYLFVDEYSSILKNPLTTPQLGVGYSLSNRLSLFGRISRIQIHERQIGYWMISDCIGCYWGPIIKDIRSGASLLAANLVFDMVESSRITFSVMGGYEGALVNWREKYTEGSIETPDNTTFSNGIYTIGLLTSGLRFTYMLNERCGVSILPQHHYSWSYFPGFGFSMFQHLLSLGIGFEFRP